jgi:hypothetical protein
VFTSLTTTDPPEVALTVRPGQKYAVALTGPVAVSVYGFCEVEKVEDPIVPLHCWNCHPEFGVAVIVTDDPALTHLLDGLVEPPALGLGQVCTR